MTSSTNQIYALLSAYNPMGEDREAAVNEAANDRLRVDIGEMTNPVPAAVLASYGTDETASWREDGFAVRFDGTEAAEAGLAAAAKL